MGKQMAACSEPRMPTREADATGMLGLAGTAASHGHWLRVRELGFSRLPAGLSQGRLSPGAPTGRLVTPQAGRVENDLKTTT